MSRVRVSFPAPNSRSHPQEQSPACGVLFFRRQPMRNVGNRHRRRYACDQSPAGWQSGYAADCKSAYAGSIPTSASNFGPCTQGPALSELRSPAQAGLFFCARSRGVGRRALRSRPRRAERSVILWQGRSIVAGRASTRSAGFPGRRRRVVSYCRSRGPGPDGEIGRRIGLKIRRPQGHAGSSPAPGTTTRFPIAGLHRGFMHALAPAALMHGERQVASAAVRVQPCT